MATPGRRLDHDWFPRALPANVSVGVRSWIYSSFAFRHYASTRDCGVRIGSDCGIYEGTFFELGEQGAVEVGDFSTLVGVTIVTNRQVKIGKYVFVAHGVVIADEEAAAPPTLGRGAALGPGTIDPGPDIVLGENSWICMHAVLLAGTRIGKGAIVGAAAVVDTVVPDYAIVAGNPAAVVGWVNR